ncbi:hypothetical protein EON65_43105 [archaeon]|nr:MAG: hypothetical protein EON65_43105 [archaeon]
MSSSKASQNSGPNIVSNKVIDERDRELMRMIKEANLQFDQIFHKVAASRNYNQLPTDPSVEMPLSAFSDNQKVGIVRLAGYYKSIEEHWQHRILDQIQHVAGFDHLQTEIKRQPLNYSEVTELKKTLSLLQEYLVNEIILREEAEQKTANLEQEIVKIIEERNRLEKKLSQLQPLSSSDRLQRGKSAEGFVGSYIRKEFNRKPFFGVIANFDHPFYQIVYEDADYEDLGHTDVEKLLWQFNVPQKKQEACMRHAKKLDLLHASLLYSNGAPSNGRGDSRNGASITESLTVDSSTSASSSAVKTKRTPASTASIPSVLLPNSLPSAPPPVRLSSSHSSSSSSSFYSLTETKPSVLDGVMKGFKFSSIIGKFSTRNAASSADTSLVPAVSQQSSLSVPSSSGARGRAKLDLNSDADEVDSQNSGTLLMLSAQPARKRRIHLDSDEDEGSSTPSPDADLSMGVCKKQKQ